MGRPVDLSLRYVSEKRCSVDGTYERYRKSDHCCKCRERENESYRHAYVQKPRSNKKPAIVERVIPLRDPTKGAAFADSIRHLLRAGHA